jgi:hypothetical protein
MATFIEAVGLTALLGLVCLFVGRLLAASLGIRLLRRAGPESLLASAFLGTGFLMLAYGWGSYAGLPARGCLLLVGLILAALVAWLAARRRLGEAIRRPTGGAAGGLIVLALIAQAAVSLLPLAMKSSRLIHGDNALYFGPAEWLQGHGFGTTPPPDDPAQPIVWNVRGLHRMDHRMGPMFLLALMRAAVPFRVAAELYPAVLAWGGALNIAGVFLLARWALRVPRFPAAAGAVAVAIACNSLTYSEAAGFFCQVYGTGLLAFGLALLSRLPAPANWRPGHAALLGIVLPAQASAYSEVLPVLALATLGVGGYALWRARRSGWHTFAAPAGPRGAPRGNGGRESMAHPSLAAHSPWSHLGRLFRFAGLSLLAVVLFGNWECVRAARGVLFMTRLNGVGSHIPWGPAEYARFALGFFASPAFLDPSHTVPAREDWITCALAGAACLVGVGVALRHRRGLALGVAGLVFAGLAAYFGLRAHDPWTGAVGHTWNLFKLSKWSFALVAPFQVAGLAALVRRLHRPQLVTLLACAALACLALPIQWQFGRLVVGEVHAHSGPARLSDLGRLCRRIDSHAPRRLYLASAPTTGWERWLPAFLLCPRPFANGWKGSEMFETPEAMADRPDAFEPGTLYLLHGVPPFSPPLERLPFEYSILDGSRPVLFHVENVNGVEGRLGSAEGCTWLGTAPAGLFILSPRAGPAELSFTVEPGPCLPETARRSLRLTDEAGTSRERTVEAGPGATVVFPITLAVGINRLELRCLDQPTRAHPTDPRVLLLKVVGARVEEVAAGAH